MSLHSPRPRRRAPCSRARRVRCPSRICVSCTFDSPSRSRRPRRVSDEAVTSRLNAEGADPLTLAGVNDANLLELSRLTGVKVSLRGDAFSLSGPPALVERAQPLAQRMLDAARQLVPLAPDDVLRMSLEIAANGNGSAAATDEQRIVLKGVRRIILARPAVEAGESLGFLPGDLQAKVDPYLRPLYDALDDMMPPERVQKALETRTIEIAPLAYMRGRTLADAFVILDESQNATSAQMKMFLTRLGVNSRAVITGDTTQIDLPTREQSGLIEIERIL